MRNLHYKAFAYRLNNITAESIKQIKIQMGFSYNLLFAELIRAYKRSDRFKKKNKDNCKMPHKMV